MRLLRGAFLAIGILPLLGAAPAAPELRFNEADAPPKTMPAPTAQPALRATALPDLYGPQKISFPDGVSASFNVAYAGLPGFRPLMLDLYLPRGTETPRPLVVFAHGGGWNSGDSRHAGTFEDFPRELASLAAQGYVVASVNYRLSEEARFPAALQDVKTAIRWLRIHAGEYNIDTTRVAVWGASAGAQLAALTGVTCGVERFEPNGDGGKDLPSDCVQAVIDWYGATDLQTLSADNGKPVSGGFAFAAGSTSAEGGYLGCEPANCAPGLARLSSPLAFVSARSPAFLIQHGAADTTVAPRQSQKLHDALRAAGVPSQIVLYPDVGHDFARAGAADAAVNAAAMDKVKSFLAATFPNIRIAGRPPIRRGPLD